MNNEKMNQIIDEVYENYLNQTKDIEVPEVVSMPSAVEIEFGGYRPLSQEEFINKCKTDSEFSEKWGLKIEEREVLEQVDQTNPILKGSTALYPRKLITITYNNETIEVYE